MRVTRIEIRTEYITLDAFLKWAGTVNTGGHAKILISSGAVVVNGEPETRRGRKLRPGDEVRVSAEGQTDHWILTEGQE